MCGRQGNCLHRDPKNWESWGPLSWVGGMANRSPWVNTPNLVALGQTGPACLGHWRSWKVTTVRSDAYDYLLAIHCNCRFSRTVSEINGDFGLKRKFFLSPLNLTPALWVLTLRFCSVTWVQKKLEWWLTTPWKVWLYEYVYSPMKAAHTHTHRHKSI